MRAICAECDRLEQSVRTLWSKDDRRLIQAVCYIGAYLEQSPEPDLFEALHYLCEHRDVLESWGVDGDPLHDLSEAELFAAFAKEQISTARYHLLERVANDVGDQKALHIAATAVAMASKAIVWAYGLSRRH